MKNKIESIPFSHTPYTGYLFPFTIYFQSANIENPASSIENPVSIIQHPASNQLNGTPPDDHFFR